MRIRAVLTTLSALCLGGALPLHAQPLVGTWQGPRTALKVTKTPSGELHGEIYYLGPEVSGFTHNGNPVSMIMVEGRHFRFDLDESSGEYDGVLSADGKTLAGIFTTSGGQFPFKLERTTGKTATPIDPSPHKVLFVPVEKDVRLEVLDWGGNGPPLVFLAGLGNTAHVFDDLAPKFTGKHHVYGITRRGFGLSSKPAPTNENYDADRLGDDVLAVIDALKLDRPVIAGHSVAGEELSSIGTRHPERVSGLIYLDASYSYAFYNSDEAIRPAGQAVYTDIAVMRRDLLQLLDATPSRTKALIQEVQSTIPRLQTELQLVLKKKEGQSEAPPPLRQTPRDMVEQYIRTSGRKYTAIKGPVLAIVAVPKACGAYCDAPAWKTQEGDDTAQADAFEAGTPSARVVRIPHAEHYVFLSNEADVLQEMNAFMDGLR